MLAWKRVPSTELLVPLVTVLTGSVVLSSAWFVWHLTAPGRVIAVKTAI